VAKTHRMYSHCRSLSTERLAERDLRSGIAKRRYSTNRLYYMTKNHGVPLSCSANDLRNTTYKEKACYESSLLHSEELDLARHVSQTSHGICTMTQSAMRHDSHYALQREDIL